jgi:hypothetical protein
MKSLPILTALAASVLLALAGAACEPDINSLGICDFDAGAPSDGALRTADSGSVHADVGPPSPHDASTSPGQDASSTPGQDASTATPGQDASTTTPGEDASSSAGQDAGTTPGQDAGAPTKHVIDGVNDFTSGETFVTTSAASGYTGYLGWDDVNVYFGMSGADVGSGLAGRWVLVYVDGNLGQTTTVGLSYDASHPQQPTLPFGAGVHLRWKADGSYTNSQTWNGAAWIPSDTTIPITVGHLTGNTFMEMSVTRASLGSPTSLKVHLDMLKEDTTGTKTDWTFAGVPSTSFTDGFDPDYTKYFQFDLSYPYSKAPNAYSPQP